ncbi:MAG: DUF6034 family protein [Candidatus Limiplasma sp.]|nr:DUF6034 family protein [Candidatus Limiplasma sp.]
MTMVFALGTNAIAAQYVSINDLKEETKGGWHETYHVNGEAVVLDVDIEIPDINRVPVVKIRYPVDIQPINPPPNADILLSRDGFSYSIESKPKTIFGGNVSGTRNRSLGIGVQAENSPLTADEAVVFARELFFPYVEQTNIDYDLLYVDAFSRLYKVKDSNASGVVGDYGKPITEMGCYTVQFRQSFYGIPYVRTAPPFINPPKSKIIPAAPRGDIVLTVASPNDYAILFHPAIEDGIVEEDVPLAPFLKVKKEFERLIEAGYIKAVYKVRLEYVRMNNPDDIENSAILVPVWELNGTIVQNPKSPGPLPSFSEAQLQFIKEVGGAQEVLVDAQTAVYYDPQDNRANRGDANIITWNEVK